jgi:hypothetical protein
MKGFMLTDQRYAAMYQRLSSLTSYEIRQILRDMHFVLFDTYNSHDGKYCPLGVALGLHKLNLTDEQAKAVLAERFKPINILHGVPGEFYHGTDEERKCDLVSICEEILSAREYEAYLT